MKVYVDSVVAGHPLAGTVRDLAAHATRHQLTSAPADADIILLCGPFARNPERLLGHPLLRQFRRKCAVYTEDDFYCPLRPGVYTSPRQGISTLIGRVRSHAFATSYGPHVNEEIARAQPLACRSGHLLCSFEGTLSSTLRRRLLSLVVDPDEAVITDTSGQYSHFDKERPGRRAGQRRYVETMQHSRFVLCPRGVGTGTLRLFEAMSLGISPVLLSDRYTLPRGPEWERFLVRLPERRLHDLLSVLRARSEQSEEYGRQARLAWERWFSPEVIFDGLVDAAADALRAGQRFELLFRFGAPIQIGRFRLGRSLRRGLSKLIRGTARPAASGRTADVSGDREASTGP